MTDYELANQVHSAIESADAAAITRLLDTLATVEAKPLAKIVASFDKSLLVEAIEAGGAKATVARKLAVIDRLIAAGCTPSGKPGWYETPLTAAISTETLNESQRVTVVKALLARGADPAIARQDHKLPRQIAEKTGKAKIAALLPKSVKRKTRVK